MGCGTSSSAAATDQEKLEQQQQQERLENEARQKQQLLQRQQQQEEEEAERQRIAAAAEEQARLDEAAANVTPSPTSAKDEQEEEEEAEKEEPYDPFDFSGLPTCYPPKARIEDWEKLGERIPHEKGSDAQKQKRDRLFDEMGGAKNNRLSLADVTVGLEEQLCVSDVVPMPSVVKVSLDSVKKTAERVSVDNNKPPPSKANAESVHRNEFRLLLSNTRMYFELFQLFEHIDADGDLKIDAGEFASAGPILERWGVEIDDFDETFRAIDTEGLGMCNFDAFASWAQQQANLASPGQMMVVE